MKNQRLTAALELIGVLAERFPAAFTINPRHRQPLKLGIHHDIAVQLGDAISPRTISDALRVYVGNPWYLKMLIAGADRVDLNGMPAGTVTAEHADIAKAQYEQRRAKHNAKQKQQAPANGAAKPELRSATVEKKPDAAPRRLGLADLRAAAKARQAVA
jgi:ProP effector